MRFFLPGSRIKQGKLERISAGSRPGIQLLPVPLWYKYQPSLCFWDFWAEQRLWDLVSTTGKWHSDVWSVGCCAVPLSNFLLSLPFMLIDEGLLVWGDNDLLHQQWNMKIKCFLGLFCEVVWLGLISEKTSTQGGAEEPQQRGGCRGSLEGTADCSLLLPKCLCRSHLQQCKILNTPQLFKEAVLEFRWSVEEAV